MAGVSIRAYARHRGVSHTAVAKAIKTHRISVLPGGGIDPVTADREWLANTDQTKPSNSIIGSASRAKPDALAVAAPPSPITPIASAVQQAPAAQEPAGAQGGLNYAQNRALREAYLARLARLDYEQRSGKLINADEVKVAWFKVISEAKTKLLSVGSKSKALIPHLSPDDVGIIDQLIRDALEEVAECPLPAKN